MTQLFWGASGPVALDMYNSGCHDGPCTAGHWEIIDNPSDQLVASSTSPNGFSVSGFAPGNPQNPSTSPSSLTVSLPTRAAYEANSGYEGGFRIYYSVSDNLTWAGDIYPVDPCSHQIFSDEIISGNAVEGDYTTYGGIGMRASGAEVINGIVHYYPATYLINWGDGTTSSDDVHPFASNAGHGPLHTYAAAGTYQVSVTYSSPHNGCTATKTVNGTITILPSAPRWFCEATGCASRPRYEGSTEGFATEAECLASGCGFPGAGWYCVTTGSRQTPTYIADSDAWVTAGRPRPKYATREECPCYVPLVYWCQNNTVQSGPTPPAGVTTYPSEQACKDAGCTSVTPVYTRWRCSSTPGLCETFQTTNINEGYSNCAFANCTSTPDYNLYTRYRCDENGDCESFVTLDPLDGFQDCAHANCSTIVEPPPCSYLSHSIADITPTKTYPSIFRDLTFRLSRQGNPNRTLVVTYAWNDIPKPNPTIQVSEDAWSWVVKGAGPGTYEFIAALSQPGCPTETEEITVVLPDNDPSNDPYWCVNGVCTRSESKPSPSALGPFPTYTQCQTACGGAPSDPENPCSPLPEDFECAPALTVQSPAANASLQNFAVVRVQTADPNEELDPCHRNYPRPCNHDEDGPDLKLFVGDYLTNVAWKHIDGTPLNGTWEAYLDTRDYSNGAKNLRVSMRGVGCCRVTNSVAVTLVNTLQGNIFYRDTLAQAPAGSVIPDALIGVETRALEENSSRRYWQQWGVRSGTLLDGAYKHDDWPKHQPVLPVLGAQWTKQGERFERHTYSAHVTFRLPPSRSVRFRRKWTPQFYLSCFDLQAQSVAKIREVSPGVHFVWTQNPPRAYLYDGDKATQLANFGDNSNYPSWTPDAIDAAYWNSAEGGRKIIVIAPESEEAPDGEMFAYDLDAGETTLNYSIRRSPLVPRFIEIVNGIPIALYARDTVTHAHDLRFGAPRLAWTLPDRVTFCTVEGAVLFVACDEKLYSTDGLATPTLVHEFPAPITAATSTLVGLQSGELWKKTTTGWVLIHTHEGAIYGTTTWSAGTIGEAQTDEGRGAFGGEGPWLVGERTDGTWFDERELRVPLDLAAQGKSVTNITALSHFSVEVKPPANSDPKSNDATTPPQRDERLLLGTSNSGLLFVYQRSLLSEKDGAIPTSHDTTPRLFPFPTRE